MTAALAIKLLDVVLMLIFQYPALKARAKAGLDMIDAAHTEGRDLSQEDLDALDTDIEDLHKQIQSA